MLTQNHMQMDMQHCVLYQIQCETQWQRLGRDFQFNVMVVAVECGSHYVDNQNSYLGL